MLKTQPSKTDLFRDYVNWDRVGMTLSMVCGLHCFLTPFLLMSLPIMGKYFWAHPWVHYTFSLLIIPTGLLAFARGYRHHKNKKVIIYGLLGLVTVALTPILFHKYRVDLNESLIMILGSFILIYAHWLNQKSCACEKHHRH